MDNKAKFTRFAESNNLSINTAKIMEMTGSETMSGKDLCKMKKIDDINNIWKNSRKTEHDAAKFIVEYPKKKLEIINPKLTNSNVKFEILKHKTTTDKKNINTMKQYFNIWKNNTTPEDKTSIIIPEFNSMYITPATSPNAHAQNHYDVKSSNFHDYRYNFDYYDDTSNTIHYDDTYDTYDTHDKLYGDYDDWESYYDSIYN